MGNAIIAELLWLFDNLAWRYYLCPRTIEAAAQDFLLKRNPPRVREVLADLEAQWDYCGYGLAYKRRVARTYGLARDFGAHPPTSDWFPGWNRWLLAETGLAPEKAAEHIVWRVCELAKREFVASCDHPDA